MNDTERETLERRIDELCAEVEKYKSARDASVDLATKTIDRIRELEAEVEQLRKQLHDQQDTAGHNFVRNAREYKRVCDENAKLRELCADIYKGFRGVVFERWSYSSEDFRMYERYMRKMEIEVN